MKRLENIVIDSSYIIAMPITSLMDLHLKPRIIVHGMHYSPNTLSNNTFSMKNPQFFPPSLAYFFDI